MPLGRVLRSAKAEGQPYQVVHFDGHGMYVDAPKQGKVAEILKKMVPLVLTGPRSGSHGYLLFENPAADENFQLVDGPALGKLLRETSVPVLVLNACRSAHAEAPEKPQPAEGDIHSRVRAFGSLAQEVIDTGVAGVVAMRYNVYVVTAARFVAELYRRLAQGHSLGEAVTLGRKHLHDDPVREIAYDPRPLQDWPVPVVYEAGPIRLFPRAEGGPSLSIRVDSSEATPGRGELDPDLPPEPDVGFFGRDETLLALDRAFDTEKIVLLHAFAGSGKTDTAAEFGRWYALTGGVEGPVLFSSFEQYRPLRRVLDQMERVFGSALEEQGVHWLTLDDPQRRELVLQVLGQVPVLWIWDNVEPIAGFPAGTDSAWTPAEQKELVDFLRAARDTKAKFLLASRRDEQAWLGDLPARICIPPMPMQERVQLARALAKKRGRRLTDVQDWRPLFRFSQGNPLTITVLVGQALRHGLKTRAQIQAFVEQLRAAEPAIEDEQSEGRSKSLTASLSYGFEHAFTYEECKRLALLHLFQGFVDVNVLNAMGHPEADWCLAEIRGLTRDQGIALLDRAAEVGLLTAHGRGAYSIHPALPWFFRGLFQKHYGEQGGEAARAFVEAMGELGNYYHDQYRNGKRNVIIALKAEEANFLHARQLARKCGWWWCVTSNMQGLQSLYGHTGRWSEWARLVDEIIPDFVDSTTDSPLPGKEVQWYLVTGYLERLAEVGRHWEEAERLQWMRVSWTRQRAASALAKPSETLDDIECKAIETLAVSLSELGSTLHDRGKEECIKAYQEGYDLSLCIGDRPGSAIVAFNLGHAHKDLPRIRDLAAAERWYARALELTDEKDLYGQAKCLSQLGSVDWARFKEAQAADASKEELVRHLNAALKFYQDGLKRLPADAVDDLAVVHMQLGSIYSEGNQLDLGLTHLRESIRYHERQGNYYGAAQARFNVALYLARVGRLADARDYADAALRNCETYGDRAGELMQRTQQLIEQIAQGFGAE